MLKSKYQIFLLPNRTVFYPLILTDYIKAFDKEAVIIGNDYDTTYEFRTAFSTANNISRMCDGGDEDDSIYDTIRRTQTSCTI
jgi:hypothetical protein